MVFADEGKLRAAIRKLIKEVDLSTTPLGKARASLEKTLQLKPGTLDANKAQVANLVREELVAQFDSNAEADAGAGGAGAPGAAAAGAGAGEKRRGSAEGGEPPQKKEKKEEKDAKPKKEKNKEKKEKKKEASDEEALEAEPLSAAAAAAAAAAPPAPASAGAAAAAAAAPAAATQPGAAAPQEPGAEKAPEPAAEAAAAPPQAEAAAAAEGPSIAMAAFEAFDPAEFAEPAQADQASRSKKWALSAGDDGALRLWDLEAFTCVRVLEGHAGAVRTVAVNWEDMEALTGGVDNVRLWSLKHGGCERTFNIQAEGGCGVVAGDWKSTRVLAGCCDGKLRIWSMMTGALESSTAAHNGGVWAMQVDWKMGHVISGGDEDIKVWTIENWSRLQTISGPLGGVMCLEMCWPDSRLLYGGGSSEQSLSLRNLDGNSSKQLAGHRDCVSCIVADWSGGKAVSGGWDAQLRVWSFSADSDFECTRDFECKFGRVRCMAVNMAEMRGLCGSSAGKLHYIDLDSGAEIHAMEGHVGAVLAVSASF